MDRLQATLWQAGVEITARREGQLVLRSPRHPRRRLSVTELGDSFVWGIGDHHDTTDVAGAVRRIIATLGVGDSREPAMHNGGSSSRPR